MRKLILMMSLVLVSGCSASAGPAGPIVDVESARARWVGQTMESYRYDFDRICFCVEEAREPVTVEVRNGAVTSVTSRNTGASMLPSEILTWHTIEELLDLIAREQQEGEEVRVEYDAEGYPTVIEIGSLAADAGVQFVVSNLVEIGS